MTREEQIKTVYEFLNNEHLCVLSTVNEKSNPESAVMAFSQTDDLKLIFQTPNTTRKYFNLKKNNNISFAFGWDLERFITVQYEGTAIEASENEIDWCRKIHTEKNEKSKEYAYLVENKYFIVVPKWIRYSDIINNIVFELRY